MQAKLTKNNNTFSSLPTIHNFEDPITHVLALRCVNQLTTELVCQFACYHNVYNIFGHNAFIHWNIYSTSLQYILEINQIQTNVHQLMTFPICMTLIYNIT